MLNKLKFKKQVLEAEVKVNIPYYKLENQKPRTLKEKTKSGIKRTKKYYKGLVKRGVIKKMIVLLCTLALIATSILPFIL